MLSGGGGFGREECFRFLDILILVGIFFWLRGFFFILVFEFGDLRVEVRCSLRFLEGL